METWQKFLQGLIDSRDKFLKDVNAAIKPLPPVEQHEAASVVGYALREINSAYQWITNACMQLDTPLKDYIERGQQILADINKAYVAELVTKGELIPKARVDAGDYLAKDVVESLISGAAEKAANEREQLVRSDIQLLASRRAELSTPKTTMDGVAAGGEPKVVEPALLSREIVEKLPDELIKGDDYKEKAGLIANRLKDINALGVSAPKLLARAHELSLDDSGETQFREQLSMIKDAVDQTGGKKSSDESKAPAPFALGKQGSETASLAGVF